MIAFRETAHGRTEVRRASLLPLNALQEAPAFPGLKAIGRIEATRSTGAGPGKTVVRFVALSKVLSPQRLAAVVCARWTIENQLHRSLDVVFHEDNACTRKDNGPQNLAIIPRIAHNISTAHPPDKPIVSKMRCANWSKDFFLQLFTHVQ